MTLGTVFKLSVYGLIGVVGAILGAAETEGAVSGKTQTELFLPFLSIPVAVCGYFLTEKRTLGLGVWSANLMGMIALLATAYQFNSENKEGKLIAGTHLLLYATWIVLFQQKNVRSYWFLMALGILQLAIASVLTKSGWFGFSAVGYMFGAIWTLSIFSLWRAEQLFEEENQKRKSKNLHRRGEDLVSFSSRRMPTSEVRGAVQHEDGTEWLTARFVSGVLSMTLFALFVSAAFFAFIPRVWVGPDFSYQDELVQPAAVARKTGMATSVKLGELGHLLISAERVFDIQIMNLRTKQMISVPDYAEQLGLVEPLFRGSVLTKYKKGRWTNEGEGDFHSRRRLVGGDKNHDVRQDIHLEKNAAAILFCLGIPREVCDSSRQPIGSYDHSLGVLIRSDTGPLDYSVFSSFDNSPSGFKLRVGRDIRRRYQDYLELNTVLPEELSELKKLASAIIKKQKDRLQRTDPNATPRELTPREIAETLEFHLRNSGEYRYSVDISIQDPKRDPIEDFLFIRKTGNCEYFATALTLMLRAMKIPARIVSGYKGGYENPEKKDFVFEVQQRYAHLWVEAWVDREDVGWTTFDATPPEARTSSIADFAPKPASVWSEMQVTLSGLWSENVLNMSLDRQEKSIYRPLRELGSTLMTFFRQLFTSPAAAFATLVNLLKNREQWFSIGGGLFAFAVLSILAGIIWLGRFSIRKICSWLVNQANRHRLQRHRIVEFYDRFVNLLETRGLRRDPTQTQQEFAGQVASDCLPALAAQGLIDVPEQISQFFYRVRFGDENLTNIEMDQLELSLTQLEKALASGDQKL